MIKLKEVVKELGAYKVRIATDDKYISAHMFYSLDLERGPMIIARSPEDLDAIADEIKEAARRIRIERGDRGVLSIIGRERALVDGITRSMHSIFYGPPPGKKTLAPAGRSYATSMHDTRRGSSFDVQVVGPDGEPTGHVATVSVEIRFETPE